MKTFQVYKQRYCLLITVLGIFIFTSFLVRTALLLASIQKADFDLPGILKIYGLGLVYDIGVSLFLVAFHAIHLLLIPSKWAGSILDRCLTWFWAFMVLLIIGFSFFAEFTFWQESESRFNFIGVDYLIYAYEVVNNINESYPLPLLIGGVLIFVAALLWLLVKTNVFKHTFRSEMPLSRRLTLSLILLAATCAYPVLLSNAFAESGNNRYENELAKAGMYSFFAAFRNNELNYTGFYAQIPDAEAFSLIRKELGEANSHYTGSQASIKRHIVNSGIVYKPNVIMITVESLSATFMSHFGNKAGLMPQLDSLADTGLLFTNMYATGTRTVRGMEALSLAIPPTPGNSIVRRQDNQRLNTVGHIFEKAGYSRTFYYGGDGYFDDMNEYFGENGFDITDRGRNIRISDTYQTKRTVIADKYVHFENA